MTHIDELILRIPGLNAEEGRRLGETVVRQMSDKLPEYADGRSLDALDVQISLYPGMGHSQIADAIVDQLVRQLKITLR